jgi:hypothetical protein
MKIKITGLMNLEQFSRRFEIALYQLEKMGVNQVGRCNLYLTPVDQNGEEIHIYGDRKKPIKEIEIKPQLEEDPTKLTILKKDL